MALQDELRKAADLLLLSTDALSAITSLTKTTADDQAVTILKVIATIAETALSGLQGNITPEAATKGMHDLTSQLAADDAQAKQMVHDKFDKTTGG